MNIEKLRKEDFKNPFRGAPIIRFTASGLIYLNKHAIKHLHLKNGKGFLSVHICHDKSCRGEFFIMKDDDGWCLRRGPGGGGVFNNIKLVHHVIDATWERCQSHPVAAVKPKSLTFKIAHLPIDDDRNKNVFALLRKKE